MEDYTKLLAGRKTGRPGEKNKEMREEVADETCEKAHHFINNGAKKFKRGY